MADHVAAAFRAMLGPNIGVGVTDPRSDACDLWPAERQAVAHSVPKRQKEFAAGRRAARIAIDQLGLPAIAIPVGPQRAPVWADGLRGSIAHCDSLCIAVVSQTHCSIGIDIEPATALDSDLIPIICTPQEQDWLRGHSPDLRGIMAKQIFCAKEAVYKTQYVLTGQVIGFDAVSLRVNQDNSFDVITLRPWSPALPPIDGAIDMQNGMILACAWVAGSGTST